MAKKPVTLEGTIANVLSEFRNATGKYCPLPESEIKDIVADSIEQYDQYRQAVYQATQRLIVLSRRAQ